MKPRGDADALIVALDFKGLDPALELVDRLDGLITRFKVGLELFTVAGPEAVRELRRRRRRVFLDLKLHDIPETVRRAARAAAELGADTISIHTVAGPAALAAAAEGARHGGGAQVLGVTVLTSFDALELGRVDGGGHSIEELVVRRAGLAREAGCDGVVCSPREVQALRRELPRDLVIVTPGVRADGAEAQDQRRVATAGEAMRAGADAVVVGRPIREALDPRAAAIALLEELATS